MTEIYLFDWGDTLMVDFVHETGKMCDWTSIQPVEGAKSTLATLSKRADIYIATSASDSTEAEIKQAFYRVGLSQYITGYFCKNNTGFNKGEPAFLTTIICKLNKPIEQITMVGDNFEKDIKPAIAIGIKPIWFTPKKIQQRPKGVKIINKLSDLCK